MGCPKQRPRADCPGGQEGGWAQGPWQAGEQTLSLPPQSPGGTWWQGPTLLSRVPVSPQFRVAHQGQETNDSTYLSDGRQAGHILPGARANKVTLHSNTQTTLRFVCLVA